jgi:2-polyprenyl-3-methyl-5-hydroxy-6-metoxy-1,4-benzoquinol methylase
MNGQRRGGYSVAIESISAGNAGVSAYQQKAASYFDRARLDFVHRLPLDASASVLEIGCGTGATGALAMTRGRAGRYVGVELFESAAAEARKVLSEVHVGDAERMEFAWRPAEFDALILSEVLEHLLEPWTLLQRLAPFVRPGGLVLASSPNISHWRVLRELAMGRFPLAEQGVFDRTHMRWFTPATFAAMFSEAGFAVDRVQPVTPFSERTELLSRLTGGRFDHLFMVQISLEGHRR